MVRNGVLKHVKSFNINNLSLCKSIQQYIMGILNLLLRGVNNEDNKLVTHDLLQNTANLF